MFKASAIWVATSIDGCPTLFLNGQLSGKLTNGLQQERKKCANDLVLPKKREAGYHCPAKICAFQKGFYLCELGGGTKLRKGLT